MHWHNLRTLATEAWQEGSTWLGAGGVVVLAALFTAGELAELTARLGAASGLIASVVLILRRARGGE